MTTVRLFLKGLLCIHPEDSDVHGLSDTFCGGDLKRLFLYKKEPPGEKDILEKGKVKEQGICPRID